MHRMVPSHTPTTRLNSSNSNTTFGKQLPHTPFVLLLCCCTLLLLRHEERPQVKKFVFGVGKKNRKKKDKRTKPQFTKNAPQQIKISFPISRDIFYLIPTHAKSEAAFLPSPVLKFFKHTVFFPTMRVMFQW